MGFSRAVQSLIDSFISKALAPVYFSPQITHPRTAIQLSDLWDGILNAACPKRKVNRRKVLQRRYGSDNWKFGQKLFKSRRDIVTCSECGNFHEIHTICRNCYQKIADESKGLIDSIRKTWGLGVIDKEVKIIYQGEQSSISEQKRIVEQDRPRPLWFVPNISQKTANPAKNISSNPREVINRVVVEKNDT